MKVLLMHPDSDFDPNGPLPYGAQVLTEDLELETIFAAMGGEDTFLIDVCRHAVLAGLPAVDQIAYRQRVLEDCLAHPQLIRSLYGLAVEAIEREKKAWGWVLSRHPDGVLLRSLESLRQSLQMLARLRETVLAQREALRSEGFRHFCEMLERDLSEQYLQAAAAQLEGLRFRHGVEIRASLDAGNRGADYALLPPLQAAPGLMERLHAWGERLSGAEPSGYSYQVADRDEAGLQALQQLRERGISAVAAALGRSADHVAHFFVLLRTELAFYIGCLNLSGRLDAQHRSTCIPLAAQPGGGELSARRLYDASLCLRSGQAVVDNDLDADGRRLVMITGANRGGKSTLLRALGQAQLMMQAGMFVAADAFRAEIRSGVFTHFKREEDPQLRGGKFDEELERMSGIIDHMSSRSLLLLNESFAATNEREGSEVAAQILSAVLDCGIRVLYVTHLFELAQLCYRTMGAIGSFLRAERLPDGRRTFRLSPGKPLPSAYGEDLYRRIFGQDRPAQGPSAAETHAARRKLTQLP